MIMVVLSHLLQAMKCQHCSALEFQRATLEWKCRGLASTGLQKKTAASSMTLGGILKHMAYVENHWFSDWLMGRDKLSPWREVDWSQDRDWDWNSAAQYTTEPFLTFGIYSGKFFMH